jgi:hypothetical protein
MVELLFAGNVWVEDEDDASTNGNLAFVPLEMASEDQTNPFPVTFNNTVFTDIDITIVGYGTQTASPGGSTTFTFPSNPGSFSYSAVTSGKTNTGTTIGDVLTWDYTKDVTGMSSASYDLVVSSNYFFIYVQNTSITDLHDFYVNYGTAYQTFDDILLPNDGVTYRTGYYRAFNDTEVQAWWTNDAAWVYWNQGVHFTLPFTQNQSTTLLYTYSGAIIAADPSDVTVSSDLKSKIPMRSEEAYAEFDLENQGETKVDFESH